MLLFVGLGNPGAGYARNRHNIGFMVVDEIRRHHDFGPERARFQGLAAEGRIGGEKVLALKPQTYMNRSGQSVGAAARFFKLDPASIVVFHDEIDLAPGKVKVKDGGGHAGHNGLRDIIPHIGPDFLRVRIGVGHPGDKDRVMPYVLSDFAKAEQKDMQSLCETIAKSAAWLVEKDYPRFMTEIARHHPRQQQAEDTSGQ